MSKVTLDPFTVWIGLVLLACAVGFAWSAYESWRLRQVIEYLDSLPYDLVRRRLGLGEHRPEAGEPQ